MCFSGLCSKCDKDSGGVSLTLRILLLDVQPHRIAVILHSLHKHTAEQLKEEDSVLQHRP